MHAPTMAQAYTTVVLPHNSKPSHNAGDAHARALPPATFTLQGMQNHKADQNTRPTVAQAYTAAVFPHPGGPVTISPELHC